MTHLSTLCQATRAYLHKEDDVEAALARAGEFAGAMHAELWRRPGCMSCPASILQAGFKVTKREMTATSFYFSVRWR